LLPSLKDLISASNGRVYFVPLDVTNDESITAAAQLVTQQLGNNKGLDVLIHNAGI
jgi:NAD(P)-dependent dehydrogenase (short-subunit alcohol dehydrogenase family)